MIDTHAHLNFPELVNKAEEVLERAEEAGVSQVIVPGTSVYYSTSSVKLSNLYQSIKSAVGIHPHHISEYDQDGKRKLLELLEKNDTIVSIGEVGLDYCRLEVREEQPLEVREEQPNEKQKSKQKQVFLEFIQLAKERNLPLIIHSREAFEDTFTLLSREASGHPTVLHCFTGSREQAKQWLELGYYLSFTGIITYKKNQELRDMIREIPLERVMIETDAPFLAPEGYRNEVCEPRHLVEVAKCLADIFQKSLEEIDRVTTETAQKFFRIP